MEIVKVPPNFSHPKNSKGEYIPGAHLQLLHALPPEQRNHFQYYETVSEGTPVSPIFPSEKALARWLAANRQSKGGVKTGLVRRAIPGTQEAKDREFIYVESMKDETFHEIVDAAFEDRSIARPKAGGAGEERAQIKLANGIALMGISYKGDLEGWRTFFVAFCVASGRKYGFIKEGRLVLSDGSAQLLEELEISFET